MKMTLIELKERIQNIKDMSDDSELAKLVLTTSDIDFSRWYA